MPTPSAAVIDALNSLLEAEANSIFHFVGAGSPYLAHAGPEVRQPLEEMRKHLDQHEVELADLIRAWADIRRCLPSPAPEDQYLSFLSLKFLLPKLVDAKELMIRRHENVLRTLDKDPQIISTLRNHIAEMRTDLATLRGLPSMFRVRLDFN